MSSSPALTNAWFNLVARLPASRERVSNTPEQRAEALARGVAQKAAVLSCGLALPVGLLGWLTIIPELILLSRLQSQMVADIAQIYGKQASLTRGHMVHCLFRHSAAHAVRGLAVQAGERYLMQQLLLRAPEHASRHIGMHLVKRAAASSVARWLPVVGALCVGAYAYYDTKRVARTAIKLFAQDELVQIQETEVTQPINKTSADQQTPAVAYGKSSVY